MNKQALLETIRPASKTTRTLSTISKEDEGNYVGLGVDGLVALTSKLLATNRGVIPPDNRDSLGFKTVLTPDKLMAERVRMDAGKVRLGLLRKLARQRSLKNVVPGYFTDYARGLIEGNSMGMPLEEINPMHVVEQARRVTAMGPGGLGSDDAITEDAQAVSASQFGYFSPSEGPECLTGDQEVYTLLGWVKWSDVDEYTKFACRIDGATSFVRPWRLIREKFIGSLTTIKSTDVRLSVTGNHRIVYKTEGSGWKKKTAESLAWQNISLPSASYDEIPISATEWGSKAFEGVVYCAEVEGGQLLVRGDEKSLPVWTGNSSRAGIDKRLANGVRYGSDGQLYQVFVNRKTGKREWVSHSKAADSIIKIPD